MIWICIEFLDIKGPDDARAYAQGSNIYLGAGDDSIIALHPDGRLKWGIRMPTVVCSAPAVGPDGTIYLLLNDGTPRIGKIVRMVPAD